MTIASLVVKLSMNVAEFHKNAEAAARRIERTGRTITRVGREISMAISLPLIAGAFGAFHALLEESARSFGPLFQATESLKASLHGLFLAIGRELQPTFLQIIDLLRGGIAILRGWIEAFHQLPAGVRQAVIYVLAFFAALGPTIFLVGKLVTAVGALIKILPVLFTTTNLATGGILLIAAALIYAATHIDWTHYRLVLFATFLVSTFFEAVGVTIDIIDVLTLGVTKVTGLTDTLRHTLEGVSDVILGKLGGSLVELQGRLHGVTKPLVETTSFAQAAAAAYDAFNVAIRTSNANAAVFGAEFNRNAATAKALKDEIDALTAAAIRNNVALFDVKGAKGETLTELAHRYRTLADAATRYDEALNVLGPTLEDHARLLQLAVERNINLDTITRAQLEGLKSYAQGLVQVNDGIRTAIIDAWTALGQRLGAILGGVAQGFRGFGKVLEGILGAMLQTVGQAMIAAGVAATHILTLFSNPFALIAAGIALVALGSALTSAAQKSVNSGLGAGGGGGGGASVATTAASGEGSGVLILELHGDAVIATLFQDPRNADALAEALSDLSGREVRVEPRSVA